MINDLSWERAMCRLSSSRYDDLYRRTNSGVGRSLLGWLRELWQARKPQVREADVVTLLAGEAAPAEAQADHENAKAA
jgi:hypothetical protein